MRQSGGTPLMRQCDLARQVVEHESSSCCHAGVARMNERRLLGVGAWTLMAWMVKVSGRRPSPPDARPVLAGIRKSSPSGRSADFRGYSEAVVRLGDVPGPVLDEHPSRATPCLGSTYGEQATGRGSRGSPRRVTPPRGWARGGSAVSATVKVPSGGSTCRCCRPQPLRACPRRRTRGSPPCRDRRRPGRGRT